MDEPRTTTTISAPRETERRSRLVSELQAIVGTSVSRSQIELVIQALEQRRDPLVDETQPAAPLAGLIERLGGCHLPVTVAGDEATGAGQIPLGQTFAADLLRWLQRGGFRIVRA
jgi:hypothetical protein